MEKLFASARTREELRAWMNEDRRLGARRVVEITEARRNG